MEPFIPQPSPGRRDGGPKYSLRHRLRIWWHRRAAKHWYEEYLCHRNSIQMHEHWKYRCLARGNQHQQIVTRLEAEAKA
ncbi:MAG: hypothetical protein NUV51_00650 [Sulfuricaulis sp.]|nr:hypothetical protein [Sulfuricaulis sp.]